MVYVSSRRIVKMTSGKSIIRLLIAYKRQNVKLVLICTELLNYHTVLNFQASLRSAGAQLNLVLSPRSRTAKVGTDTPAFHAQCHIQVPSCIQVT